MSYSLAFSQSLIMLMYIGGKVELGFFDFVPTQQISHDLNVPPSTAGLILRHLSRAGIIETREGANGGIRLALPPEQITVRDIFTAIERERPLFQTKVNLRTTGEKPTRAQQAMLEVLADAEEAMKQSLETRTLRDLMQKVNP
ncbi:MAG: Rrf2 family transcriptional regulator [Chloroflexi bacterium]|nr:Rrf2 family transcriptional regulator [Chloroflexota bacterium]